MDELHIKICKIIFYKKLVDNPVGIIYNWNEE